MKVVAALVSKPHGLFLIVRQPGKKAVEVKLSPQSLQELTTMMAIVMLRKISSAPAEATETNDPALARRKSD